MPGRPSRVERTWGSCHAAQRNSSRQPRDPLPCREVERPVQDSPHPIGYSPNPEHWLLKENPKDVVLLCFALANLLGISRVLFLAVPAAACDPTHGGRIHPSGVPRPFTSGFLQVRVQGLVLGHFVHGCRQQAFYWADHQSNRPGLHLVSLCSHACQHSSQCWLTQGLSKPLASLLGGSCQTGDRQLFREESCCLWQLIIHQVSGICLILSVGRGYAIAALWLHFPTHTTSHSWSTFLSPVLLKRNDYTPTSS